MIARAAEVADPDAGGSGRKMLAIRRTPSRIGTGTSFSNRTPGTGPVVVALAGAPDRPPCRRRGPDARPTFPFSNQSVVAPRVRAETRFANQAGWFQSRNSSLSWRGTADRALRLERRRIRLTLNPQERIDQALRQLAALCRSKRAGGLELAGGARALSYYATTSWSASAAAAVRTTQPARA